MQLEICTQLFRPVPVIITLNTRPTAIIKDYIAAHFQDMFCNVPHDLFYALMSFIVIGRTSGDGGSGVMLGLILGSHDRE